MTTINQITRRSTALRVGSKDSTFCRRPVEAHFHDTEDASGVKGFKFLRVAELILSYSSGTLLSPPDLR